MCAENPRTTIYFQAVITTDAVPDFSFFNNLKNMQIQQEQPSTLLQAVADSQPCNKSTFFANNNGYDHSGQASPKQIKYIRDLIHKNILNETEILATYHVTNIENLTKNQVQEILRRFPKN